MNPFALRIGLRYFAILFALGFVLGTERTLWPAPLWGEAVAVVAELPIMNLASWLVADRPRRRFDQKEPAVGLAVGAWALLLIDRRRVFTMGGRLWPRAKWISFVFVLTIGRTRPEWAGGLCSDPIDNRGGQWGHFSLYLGVKMSARGLVSIFGGVLLASVSLGAIAAERQPVLVRYHIPEIMATKAPGPEERLLRRKFLEDMTRQGERRALREQLGVEASRLTTLWLVGGTIAELTEEQRLALAGSPAVYSVQILNRQPQLIEPVATMQAGAPRTYTYGLKRLRVPELNRAFPDLNGAGVRVGIIDTGIAPSHPDLVGKIDAFRDFTSAKKAEAYDDHGHGTHVAGTVAGGAESGNAIGVAPGARLIIAKGFNSGGGATESGLLQAMQWMADPDGDATTADQAQVVSNSWNVGAVERGMDPSEEPFCVAADNWQKLGIVPVFAAGNDGPRGSIRVPGACPNVITVGATDERDQVASFSSRGPVNWKSVSLTKPTVAAPGVEVLSASPRGGYTTKSGTSMATPHVAGAVAILLQGNVKLAPGALELALTEGAVDLGQRGVDNVYGAGRIDLPNSVQLTNGR